MVGPGGFEPPTYGSLPAVHSPDLFHPPDRVIRPVEIWSPPLCLAELRAHQAVIQELRLVFGGIKVFAVV